MKPFPLIWSLLLFTIEAFAQLNENFSDGDYTNNPVWFTSGNNDWIIDSSQMLRSNHTSSNSSFYISTVSNLTMGTEWEFYIDLDFNTSSANYVDAWVIAEVGDLNNGMNQGYFIRIGNTNDEISLYKKQINTNPVKIIDGLDGITSTSNNQLRIKLVRTAAHEFILMRDQGGSGNSFFVEGTATDSTFTTAGYFGFLIKQSTSSFFHKHFIDDISITNYQPDTDPPGIASLKALSSKMLLVKFNEPIDPVTSQQLNSYQVNNGIGNPMSLQTVPMDQVSLVLNFSLEFSIGLDYTLIINGVKDVSGNPCQNLEAIFQFYIPSANDVVITEIMADPSPTIGLPDAEFIEIKNRSGKTIDLEGWTISTTTSPSAIFPETELKPDSMLIITSQSRAMLFSSFGRIAGIPGFPSLPNEGSLIILKSKEGRTIHAINYSKDWYQNPVKEEGGWTLEMIDPGHPCKGKDNWMASIDASGGTPGNINSTFNTNPDSDPPQLLRSYSIDSTRIVAVLNETIDSTSASDNTNYQISHSIPVISATPVAPLFDEVILQLATPLSTTTVYTLTANNIRDCSGNVIGTYNKVKAGFSDSEIAEGDIIVNEILFDPRSGAYDYVELFNNSEKIMDAARLFLANRDLQGQLNDLSRLSTNHFLIFPGELVVATENAGSLRLNYFVENPGQVIILSSLPSYPDDQGNVVVCNGQGNIIDEVAYKDDWHFDLISDKEGISLERIDPSHTSTDRMNWHSAASTSGYGTPSYKNSQFKVPEGNNALIDLKPLVFSPDNDGWDDFVQVNYRMDHPGYVGNIYIFDINGNRIRHLVKNAILGIKGNWTWDGLDEKGNSLPVGHYVFFTEIFDLNGRKKQFKNAVVLARKLN